VNYSSQTEIDFNNARLRAFLNDAAAFVSRRPNELLSFDAVRRALPVYGSSYRGVQQVPVDKIVGTTSNRYADFDRAFLPAQVRTKSRWKRIDELRLREVALPPVQLYQVGDVYFVRDGHHRVSVARQTGQLYVDAEVIEMRTRVPLDVSEGRLDTRTVEALGEYAEFLEKTQLDTLRPGQHIVFSQPGGYARLVEHIVVHQYFLGLDYKRDVTWEEAVTDWHDHLFMPIVNIIRERKILKDFPGRTEADLYLWITDHHWTLTKQEQESPIHDVAFDQAAEDYTRRYSPRLARKLARAVGQVITAWRARHLTPPAGDNGPALPAG
jgi:hypothetical protein